MGVWPITRLADWFESQSLRNDVSLAERVMLENVSAWLRRQHVSDSPGLRQADPWAGLSNE